MIIFTAFLFAGIFLLGSNISSQQSPTLPTEDIGSVYYKIVEVECDDDWTELDDGSVEGWCYVNMNVYKDNEKVKTIELARGNAKATSGNRYILNNVCAWRYVGGCQIRSSATDKSSFVYTYSRIEATSCRYNSWYSSKCSSQITYKRYDGYKQRARNKTVENFYARYLPNAYVDGSGEETLRDFINHAQALANNIHIPGIDIRDSSPQPQPPQPPPPVSLNAPGGIKSQATHHSITMHWNEVVGSSGYEILYCKGIGCSPTLSVEVNGGSVRTHTITENIDSASTYRFKIRSLHTDSSNHSSYSTINTIHTGIDPLSMRVKKNYLPRYS